MSAASGTYFDFFEQANLQEKINIAFEELFTKKKCYTATFSTLSHTQFLATMFICIKIS